MQGEQAGQRSGASSAGLGFDDPDRGHFEKTPALMHSIDSSGCIVLVSDLWLEQFGYLREEVIGRKSTDFLTEVSREYAEEEVLPELFRTGQCRDIPFEWLRSDGQVVDVLLSATAIRDEARRLVGSRAVLIDVTRRKRSETSLLDTQRELELAQEVNKTGSWSFDLAGDRVWWSPELYRILRQPVAEVAPPFHTHSTLFGAKSWKLLEAAVSRAVEEGVPYELELELAESEDGPRFALARGQARRNGEGKVVRLVGTLQDVTDLVRTRRERDRAAERVALAKSAAGIGIWEWNIETDRLVWDPKMYALYGIPEAEEVRYETWSGSVLPQDLPSAEQDLRAVLDGAGDFSHTFRIQHSELGVRHIRAAATLVGGGKGDRRMIGVNWDVSDQVALEEEARRSQNLESLGLLAGGIAHDFNNLLAAIMSRAELLVMELDEGGKAHDLGNGIVGAVCSALDLTSQLLTFSRGGEPQTEHVSLEKVVRGRASFSLRGSGTEVGYSFPPDLLAVEMDPRQLGQVIQNLVLNADQAMPAGGRLEVEAENVEGSDPALPRALNGEHYVRLVIRDSGVGISEQDLRKIFDPYFSTKATGHGLGLAICHSIIERHHGSIRVESELGQGTTFSIFLPATPEASPDEEPAGRPCPGEGALLIVDDLEMVRSIIRMQLETLGYEVDDAASVEQALRMWQQRFEAGRAYDLVLTDLTIPGSGGGRQLVDELLSLDPEVRVVVSSGYGDDPVMADCRAYGFAACLSKPTRLEELGRVVAEVLAGTPVLCTDDRAPG